MLSWYEGFGLVGLEAISCGVPLILSTNTGLYRAIEELLGGEGTGCLYSVDISAAAAANGSIQDGDLSQVVDHLRAIAANPGVEKGGAKADAIKLREKLAIHWTWENTAKAVLNGLGIEVNKLSNTSVSVMFPQNTSLLTSESEPGRIQNTEPQQEGEHNVQMNQNIKQSVPPLSKKSMKPTETHRSVIISVYDIQENFKVAISDFNDSLAERDRRILDIPPIPSVDQPLTHPLVKRVLDHIYNKGEYPYFISWFLDRNSGRKDEFFGNS